MPHQCTNCGHVFPDGSKEMLSGCPDCGGNKFQFKQGSVDDVEADTSDQPAGDSDPQPTGGAEPTSGPEPDASTTPDTTANTDSPASDPTPSPEAPTDSERSDAELMESDTADAEESPAQSSARSDVVSSDELPDSPPDAPSTADADEPTTESEETAESSGLNQLRSELNDQFESIRIVSPGEYELNLMELYDRNEYIISLREDGRYIIEVPDSWDTDMPS
jgi:Zn-ribbon containing protein